MVLLSLLIALFPVNLLAQENAHAFVQANNPLANMTAFNLHDNYIGKLTESGVNTNQFWIRYTKLFSLGGDWLMRDQKFPVRIPIDLNDLDGSKCRL